MICAANVCKPFPAIDSSGAMIIETDTPRLRLRQWQASDRTPFAALSADPEVMRFFAAPLDRSASDAMADQIEQVIAQRGWGFWAVELRAQATFIGCVGLWIPTASIPAAPCVEVGWRLARPYWSNGYASEAARAALKIGFEQLALPEIVSFTACINLRSQAVMERIGMQRTEEYFDHPNLPQGHALRPHVLYRLPRATWLAQATAPVI
jgi:RimJ/RimL family protein N-acetyltransferase